MKQIFKIVFYVPNYEIKEKVFNYLNSHEISFKYESCGLNIGVYTFYVLNITETTKINLINYMREICGNDYRFNASYSLGFIM